MNIIAMYAWRAGFNDSTHANENSKQGVALQTSFCLDL